jgi:hypothetical protein
MRETGKKTPQTQHHKFSFVRTSQQVSNWPIGNGWCRDHQALDWPCQGLGFAIRVVEIVSCSGSKTTRRALSLDPIATSWWWKIGQFVAERVKSLPRANSSLASLNATSSASGASSNSPHGKSRNCSTGSFAPFEPVLNFNEPCDNSGVARAIDGPCRLPRVPGTGSVRPPRRRAGIAVDYRVPSLTPRRLMITPVGKLGAIRLHKQDIHLPEGEVMLPVQEIVHVHAAESTARDVLTHLMK